MGVRSHNLHYVNLATLHPQPVGAQAFTQIGGGGGGIGQGARHTH